VSDGGGLRPGIDDAQAVRFEMGNPALIVPLPSGGEAWFYPRGRVGRQTFRAEIGPDGKLNKVEQVLDERHFDQVIANKTTREELLRMLEMRLDNVVFRMGFARSRAEARQLVSHGHFAVNGRPTNIPSYGTKVGDRIEVRESRRGREHFKTVSETIKAAQIPEWVSTDAAKLSGSVLAEPAREQMPMEFNEQLVVEFYSR